jgi:nitrogen fixation NifU-like protein
MNNTTYTKALMKHFKNPKFVKKLKNPGAVGEVGNIKCGDIMRLEIKVECGKITDIGFQTFGCAAAIATSDVVCELAKGKTLKQAKKISKNDIIVQLGSMPPIKLHCSVLGIEALNKAIDNYENRKSCETDF